MSEATRLERRGSVFILFLGDDENRFRFDSVAAIDGFLDEVEAAQEPKALVTVGEGKFWSNGFDLEWLQRSGTALADIVAPTQQLFARMLAAPFPSVAAIQGHCYAAGAMLALSHDVRIMREDRGFLCFPEVDIRLDFTDGMKELLAAKIPQPTLHAAMVLGRRYTAPEALAGGILDATATESELLDTAVALAESLASKDARTLAAIKSRLYAPALAALRAPL